MPEIDKTIIARSLALAWSAVLICLMATGVLTAAHIGEIRYTPERDVWSAAIAISQINFGLPGHLAYREIEYAMAKDVTSKGTVWDDADAVTRQLVRVPANVTRAFQAGASVQRKDLAVPPTKAGYFIDWCEDIGYHDFYNLAFRLFGFNAFSTHWLYFCFLAAAFALFAIAFIADSVAIGSLSLGVTALFLVSASGYFSDFTPTFASGRFLSTLALIPLLHVVHTALRRTPMAWWELPSLGAQAWIMTFAITARGSAAWCVLAVVICVLALIAVRRWRMPRRAAVNGPRANWLLALVAFPFAGRVATAAAVALGVFIAFAFARNAYIDSQYFTENDYPHHLFWHNAYLGLAVNPEWMSKRPPYPDVPALYDMAGMGLYQHVMTERGLPFAWADHPRYYRARLYEAFIRDQYLGFLVRNPLYAVKLFLYYKPISLFNVMTGLVSSVPLGNWLLAACALGFAAFCFAGSGIMIEELSMCAVIMCLLAQSPLVWTTPVKEEAADPLWSIFYVGLIIIASLGQVFGQRTMKVEAIATDA